MNGIQYAQNPIRLALNVAANPPVPPIDQNTGNPPRFWRAQPVAFQVGIFDAQGNPVDLSNLQSLSLILMANQLAPVSVATVTVQANQITTGISVEDWQQGVDQNATFLFTAADADQSLFGDTSAEYWLTCVGLTNGGTTILYGGGNCDIYNPGNSLPYPTPGLVSCNKQTLNPSSNGVVTPASQLHTEWLLAPSSNGTIQLVVGATGLSPGAHVWLRFWLPTIAGLEIEIYDQSLSGSELFTIYSDPSGYTPTALLEIEFDGNNLQRLSELIPANGQQS